MFPFQQFSILTHEAHSKTDEDLVFKTMGRQALSADALFLVTLSCDRGPGEDKM